MKCTTCDADFYPARPGVWADELCGDCLAMKIQTAILAELRVSDRKPMRRATAAATADVEAAKMRA